MACFVWDVLLIIRWSRHIWCISPAAENEHLCYSIGLGFLLDFISLYYAITSLLFFETDWTTKVIDAIANDKKLVFAIQPFHHNKSKHMTTSYAKMCAILIYLLRMRMCVTQLVWWCWAAQNTESLWAAGYTPKLAFIVNSQMARMIFICSN